jgi:hypothetical protein
MVTNLISFLFLKNEEVYDCCECNIGAKAYALCTEYEKNIPYCKVCFLKKIDELASRVMNGNSETYWQDGYRKLHKEYSFSSRENKHMKCQIDLLVHDKMVLENKVENLQKEIDFWKNDLSQNI